MKISAFMLVSRDDIHFEKAVTSISEQVDEFTAYIDPIKLPDCDHAINYLHDHNARIKIQRQRDMDNHHDDVTRAVHTGILQAKYPWVLNLDDDDEAICDVKRDMVPHAAPDVGLVFGSKFKKWPGGRQILIKGKEPKNQHQVNHVNGTCLLYNREAFKKIYINIDVHHWRDFYGNHYGYYWDLKIWYWLIRGGFKIKHCGEPTVIQNVRPREQERRDIKGQWPQIARALDRLKMEQPQ